MGTKEYYSLKKKNVLNKYWSSAVYKCLFSYTLFVDLNLIFYMEAGDLKVSLKTSN